MPTLEHRKIIRVGNSLAVTIPKPWLAYYQLKEGSTVLVETDDYVRIKPVITLVKEEAETK